MAAISRITQQTVSGISHFLHYAGLLCLFLLVCTVPMHSSTDPGVHSDDPAHDRCNFVLKKFAHAAGNFSFCSLYHSKPLTFCEGCWHQYNELKTVQNQIERDPDCQMYLVYAERFQIITRTMQYAEGLWNGFNCANCYQRDSNQYAKDVQMFMTLLKNTNKCFENVTKHNNNTAELVDVDGMFELENGTQNVCNVCKADYTALKDQYRKMSGSNKAELICADITSAMNATRMKWSKQFKCIQVRKDIISVIALTCFFCFLPLVFYVGTKIQHDHSDHRKTKFSD